MLDSDDKQVAASLLWLLRGDAAQRAIAAWHFSWPPTVAASGTEWQAPFLARSLNECLPTLSSPNPATLVGPNGTLDAEIERLQRERDDRPILIPE